jgi:phosphatidylglycerophosphate synthase
MSHNTLIHRVVRIGVQPLVGTGVTPNHLTSLRLVTGLAAVAALAVGTAGWRAWGAGIFVFSLLLDRADGELARLGGSTSAAGHKYDLIADSLCTSLAFVGLGVGLRDGPFGPWAALMGLVAGAAIASILLLILRLEALEGERAGELASTAGLDPDDGLFALPLFVWLGWAEALLAAACVGAPSFAAFMYLKYRRRLRRAPT